MPNKAIRCRWCGQTRPGRNRAYGDPETSVGLKVPVCEHCWGALIISRERPETPAGMAAQLATVKRRFDGCRSCVRLCELMDERGATDLQPLF